MSGALPGDATEGRTGGSTCLRRGPLGTLARVDPRLVSVVEMRYFAGVSDAEIAAALGPSERTVRRDWERARLLLTEMLGR